jgi:hypothetical protein
VPFISVRYWKRLALLWTFLSCLCQAHLFAIEDIPLRIQRGEAFLTNLFNAQLNLLPEYQDSSTYWLFHDNYLAAHLLSQNYPDLSQRIRSAIFQYGITNSGKIEILFDEAPQALPFRTYALTQLTNTQGKTIRTEIVTTNRFAAWEDYADLLLLASIARAKSNLDEARSDFDRAARMWDTFGFSDHATQHSGLYSTYKLALYLIAAARLNVFPPHQNEVLTQLLSLQSPNGGWITDYKNNKPIGLANVETTCLALLALQSLPQSFRAVPHEAIPITAPLKAHPKNPNYFTDPSSRAVYLTGSHTWNNFQDWGTDDAPQPFDFTAYVNMLRTHHHNFTLLWQTELPVFRNLPTLAQSPPDFYVTPQPWQRTGPGLASDLKPKFDLTKFHQPYFDRLRNRVQQLQAAGIYAGVYFFSGEWLLRFRFAEDGYPLTGSNNINGIDDQGSVNSVTMAATNAITILQDAFVRKMIDTLNDLPNVLWIVSQEAPPGSEWWNNHLIQLAREYEATKPFQHPVGYGVLADSNDKTILNSDADWIAPAAKISSTRSCGSGQPACKVNINDSDHSYFGMWNDSPQLNRNFFWINFTQGNQTLFMDPYVVFYPREKRNLCPAPFHGISSAPDRRWDFVRDTMGFIRDYAQRLNLAAMTPRPALSSTGHALATVDPASPALLVYAPSGGNFTVNLSAFPGAFAVEWMNPSSGTRISAKTLQGGKNSTFSPPFPGDAVLYLRGSD